MAFPPPPHPNTRPMKDTAPFDPAGDRAFLKSWLAHVEAGRIGNNPPMSEETRAAILANERLVLGQVRSSAG